MSIFLIVNLTNIENWADITMQKIIISHEENLLLTTHIGDGYVLAFDEINAHIISEPSNGEYVNETYFFTQNDFEQNLRIYNHELTKYKYIMLTSDGLEPIIIKNKKPFEGFFNPVIKFLINERDLGRKILKNEQNN